MTVRAGRPKRVSVDTRVARTWRGWSVARHERFMLSRLEAALSDSRRDDDPTHFAGDSTNGHGSGVRHALSSEHEQLREIRLSSLATDPEAFAGTYAHALSLPPEWWHRWAEQSELGDSQRTFVLEGDDGRWMGLVLVRLDDERSGCAVLNAMWVAPEIRGRGAAGLLCEACAAWASARGCRELTLAVVADNHGAQRAYEAAGFAVSGQTTWSGDGRTLGRARDGPLAIARRIPFADSDWFAKRSQRRRVGA